MRDIFVAFLFVSVAVSSNACGGNVREVGPDPSNEEAGTDANPESGACPDGGYPISCPGGEFLYCCPAGSFCDPPSCGAPVPAQDDAGACPSDQYLLVPCCGGYNDTSCSNGPGPPAAFCTALPASCEDQSECTLNGCEGPIDESNRTLQCTCL
jgi:hypothetical protein